MKKILNIGVLFFCLMVMFSCAEKGTTVKGTIAGASGITAFLDKTSFDNTNQPLGKSEISSGGGFSINFPEGLESGVYRVRVGAKTMMLILRGDEKTIEITGDLDKIAAFDYQVSGSDLSASYQDAINKYMTKKMGVEDMKSYVMNEVDPLVGQLVAMSMFNRPDFAGVHKAVAARLKSAYPDNPSNAQYESIAVQLERSYAQQQASANIKVGQPAPDIELPGPDGKVRKLSDYKGQVVLIDFWASWCGPCRKANPKVVEAYKKYNKDGFNVFSVSLDGLDSRTKSRYSDESQINTEIAKSKDRWIEAIKKDELIWDGHVSDLKKWESGAAAMYGVTSIPKTFLLDREGKIAVIDPRYDLESQLVKFL